MLCSETLQYHAQSRELTCGYCGRVEHGHISCPAGHYICDVCHNKDALAFIEDAILNASGMSDPFAVAGLAMGTPALPMLGCQHAHIAGGALMAALRNEGSRGVGRADIEEVFRRTQKQAHGGYCGLTGVCGIAPSIGAVFAILTGSTCGQDEAQRVTMEAVTRVSRAITDLTGPSCCKAYVWGALTVAVEYLRESLSVELPGAMRTSCTYSARHPHGCREARCPYYEGTR